ncbi:helix-turn-helix domain-containing protein [Lachnospiraceae bacterium NSJ-143]|nr:helix-turn-helix domain-containing protein [Lachnospiraceae bacterium NSJ-143]
MFGDRFKELRISNCYTQEYMAEKLHVAFQTISNWENGKAVPSVETAIQIADFFGVGLDLLFGIGTHTTVDVTGLSQEQIIAVQKIITLFKAQNSKDKAD